MAGKERNPQRSNTIKEPDQWTTGDEPMTGAQASHLRTPAGEAGEAVGEKLTKAGGGVEAARRAAGEDGARGRGR